MMVRIERTYLARQVEQYDLEVPDDFDFAAEWLSDFGNLDDYVLSHGELVEGSSSIEYVDDDDLTLSLVQPASTAKE